MALYANNEEVLVAKEEQLTQIVHEISTMAGQTSEMVKRINAGLFNNYPEPRGDLKEPLCLMEELLNVRVELSWARDTIQLMTERLGV